MRSFLELRPCGVLAGHARRPKQSVSMVVKQDHRHPPMAIGLPFMATRDSY